MRVWGGTATSVEVRCEKTRLINAIVASFLHIIIQIEKTFLSSRPLITLIHESPSKRPTTSSHARMPLAPAHIAELPSFQGHSSQLREP